MECKAEYLWARFYLNYDEVLVRFNSAFLNMQPLHTRILVERIDVPSTSRIVIPDVAKESSKIAKILRVGTKVIDLKAGDIVLIPGAGAKYPDWENEDLLLITEADVGGILVDDDKPRKRTRAN